MLQEKLLDFTVTSTVKRCMPYTSTCTAHVHTHTCIQKHPHSEPHTFTSNACLTQAINTEAKLDDVKSGITMLLQARCSCAVQVLGGQFTCVDGSTVAYQADLHYRLPSDSAQPSAVGVLSAWVLENPAIPTEGILLRVNPSCRVQVTSFEDTACFPTTTDTSLSREAIIGIVIGVILAIAAVLGLVAIIIVLMLCYRKKVKD